MRERFERLRIIFTGPGFLRDLGNMFSAWRVGLWFSLLHASLLILLTAIVAMITADLIGPMADASSTLGLGPFMACVLFLGLAGICTVLMPLRASGMLDGPRWARYFDQIVISGIGPLRYMAGKIMAQNMFLLLLLVGALPYAIFCLGLGGTRPGYLLSGMLVLWLYANVLTLVTLAVGLVTFEVSAVLLTIVGFGVLFIVGIFPVPAVFSLMMPSRVLVAPIHQVLHSTGIFVADEVVWTLGGVTVTVGSLSLWCVGAGLILVLGLLFLLMGPLQCLVRANSTFGTVIEAGDHKRSMLQRMRFSLKRRAEISFFYENRPQWVVRYEIVLRWGMVFLFLLGALVLAFGNLHQYSPQMMRDEFEAANLSICILALLAGCIVFCGDKSTAATVVRFRGRATTAANVDTVGFLLFVMIVVLATTGIPMVRQAFEGSTWLSDRAVSRSALRRAYGIQSILPMFLLMVLELYAVIRWLSVRYLASKSGAVAAMLVMAFIWVTPFTVFVGATIVAEEAGRPDTVMTSAWLACLSPIPWFMAQFDELPKQLHLHCPIFAAAPLHAVLTLLAAALARRAHRAHVRAEQEVPS